MTFWRRLQPTPTQRTLQEPEAAYVGAVIDSEGYVKLREDGAGQLYVDNSETEIISALIRATGVGRVYGYRPTNGTRLMLRWMVARTPDLAALLPQILPYSLKAQQLLAHIAPRMKSWIARREMRRQFCEDCGKEVSLQGRHIRRCTFCSAKARQRKGGRFV